MLEVRIFWLQSREVQLRFLYINIQETPSYVTLSKFLNNVVVKHFEIIFAKITSTILNKYQIPIDEIEAILIPSPKALKNKMKENVIVFKRI